MEKIKNNKLFPIKNLLSVNPLQTKITAQKLNQNLNIHNLKA